MRCQECGAEPIGEARGWKTYRAEDTEDPEDEPEIVPYCPKCARREFGEHF